MNSSEPWVETFRRWARIDPIELRTGLLVEALLDMNIDSALELMQAAFDGAALRDADSQTVFLSLGWALYDERVETRRRELGEEACLRGLRPLDEILVPPTEGQGEETPRRIPDFGRGRPLTLGERKALARTHDRHLIQRVVRDPHPDVVRILLSNPALREEDVVRLCAIRPNDAEVLRAVYRHRRWVVRYRPRNAILRNPDAPIDLALLLSPLLRSGELREAVNASGLAETVRGCCRLVLERRSGD